MITDRRAKDPICGLGLTPYAVRDIIALLAAHPKDKDPHRQRSRDFLRLRLERVLQAARPNNKG